MAANLLVSQLLALLVIIVALIVAVNAQHRQGGQGHRGSNQHHNRPHQQAKPKITAPSPDAWERNPLLRHLNWAGKLKLRALRKDVQNNGCDTNICFLLDATLGVTDAEFTAQKNFADLIIAITTTDSGGNMCGALYGRRVKVFSRLTGDKLGFLDKLQALTLGQQSAVIRGRGSSNLLWAIWFALVQLFRQRGDANKIVTFSKARPLLPHWLVKRILSVFRHRIGSVCAVALDETVKEDLAILTGDLNKVVSLNGFFDLAEIIVALVSDVCSMPCKTRYGRRGPLGKPIKPMLSCPNGSTQ